MLVYDDYIIITGNNQGAIDQIVRSLSQNFVVQYMGALSYFLDVSVAYCGTNFFLSQ